MLIKLFIGIEGINMDFLQTINVSKSYGDIEVLKNVSVSVKKGEFVCLLGPSGCGKTTLLRIIAGLEDNHQGEIFIEGKDVTKFSPEKRNFGIVFQSYALFPNMTVYKNIAFGLENRKINKSEVKKKVQEVLEMVELQGVEDKYPSQLSGGQQQRVALARAIALSPDFLLLDEPLSALDAKVRVKLRSQIRQLQKKLGITTIMVTHDQEEALTMADKVIVMKDGEIMQVGSSQEIYKTPANSFVADFIGSINFIEDMSNGNSYAIRPEDILITETNDIDSIVGKIIDMEYKGSHYLITVSYESDIIKINIPSSTVESKFLKEGSTINFRILYKNTIKINKESCA